MKLRILALLGVALAAAGAARAQTAVYSQTSLASSGGNEPGLFDQFGLLGGPGSTRRDFFQIFTNPGGEPVPINKATLFGAVDTSATAVLVPVIVGTANGVPNIAIPDRDPSHVLSAVAIPPTQGAPGPIEIFFATPVLLPAGGQLAFGFLAPLESAVDATLFGTDALTYDLSATSPRYFTGFYASNSYGDLILATGNHYLVIESAPPDIQQLISFFDGCVQSETLVGNGPGNSANGRRSAFRNILAAAANLLSSGGATDALAQLEEAYLRADAVSNPADFVAGSAAADLAARIRQLIESLDG
jgi:hypothetical protein